MTANLTTGEAIGQAINTDFSREENQLGEKAWDESDARRAITDVQQAPPNGQG
jgi:hypothetical protein